MNPRHVRFYEAMLGFRRVGEMKTNSEVGAPSQLIWRNVGDIRRQIDKHAGTRESSRSLYAHFFSAKEEAGIYGRLAGLTEPTSAAIPLAPSQPDLGRAELRLEPPATDPGR